MFDLERKKVKSLLIQSFLNMWVLYIIWVDLDGRIVIPGIPEQTRIIQSTEFSALLKHLLVYLYKAKINWHGATRTISPTPPAIEISTPRKSSWDPPPAHSPPPWWLLPRGAMLQPPLSLWGLPPPPRGSCSFSSLTPAHQVQFSPLPSTSFTPRVGFARSAFCPLRSWSALSFPSPLRSTFPSRLCGPVGEHFG